MRDDAHAVPDRSVPSGAVGNDAGWTITFHRETPTGLSPDVALTLSSADYYAAIDAALPEGLGPGAYTVTVQGLINEHFAALRTAEGQPPLVAKLHLYWRDANTSVGAFFTNLVGVDAGPTPAELTQALIAVLRVTKVRRLTGERTYDTELTLVEQAYARSGSGSPNASRRPPSAPRSGPSPTGPGSTSPPGAPTRTAR